MTESTSMEIQTAIASINNEDQNAQNDELKIDIRNIVEGPEIQIRSSTRCCIYKVPRLLRNWNEEAYTPQVVSIGPFHHKNKRLKAMEKHKERYFRSFVKRSGINSEYLVDRVREMEESIRGCYEGTIDLASDRFVKMILVDACFILELFFKHSRFWRTDDPMRVQLRDKAMMLDLVLLENQLPFFVFEELNHLAFPSLSDIYLLQLSFQYFSEFNIQFIQPHSNVRIEHFTDLLRTFQIPPPRKLPRRVNQPILLFYSATQLYEAGVKFKVHTSKSYFDIKFEKGVLKIPSLESNNWTDVVARNIIALEQTHYIIDGYFTDYFIFMDLLVKTRKDVDLLRDKNILVNYVGYRYPAESMIMNLNKGILWISTSRDYVDLCYELNRFCNLPCPWPRWMAILRREFFGTPSQATSTIVTLGVITVLTFIQTVCSIMQVTGSR